MILTTCLLNGGHEGDESVCMCECVLLRACVYAHENQCLLKSDADLSRRDSKICMTFFIADLFES